MTKLTFKKSRLIRLATLLTLHWLCVEGGPAQAATPISTPQAELLVKLRRDAAREDAGASAHASVGATVIRCFDELGWQLVRLPVGMSSSAGIARYRTHADVAAVEPNGIIYLPAPPSPEASDPPGPRKLDLVTPNDPRYPSQWNLRKIGMPAAWEVTTGSSNVVVAVMDSGVDYSNPDLRDNMWRNPGETGLDAEGKDKATNGIDDDDNGYVDDVFGIDTGAHDSDPMDRGFGSPFLHGTECAGVLGAVGNNGRGTAGVSWSIQIMAVRLGFFMEPENNKVNPLRHVVANVLEAFNYVVQQRRRGVNVRLTSNSWRADVLVSQAIQEAFDIAGKEGILAVCGAGNDGRLVDNHWRMPAAFDSPYVLTVAASDQSDQLTSFSNFGRSVVDLAAPGIQIPVMSTNSGQDWRGTSAACPHVTGAAALLLAVKPEATPLQLKAVLMQSVDQPSALRNMAASHGRLNVPRAFQVLTNTELPAVVVGAFPASGRTRPDSGIEIWFSAPMERASVEAALQFTPAIPGAIEWSEGDQLVRLRPSVPLLRTNYTARILGTARDVAGRTIDGDFDRASEGAPADDFLWSFRFASENDDFVNASPLAGAQGLRRDSTVNASEEADEPLGNDTAGVTMAGPSLWYSWLAETNGWMTFETITSGTLDTFVIAYTGQTLDALEEVAFGDDFGLRKGGRVSFPVRAGTNYSITVVGNWSVSAQQALGDFTLSWYPTPPPGLTGSQFLPAKAPPGSLVTLSGTHLTGATNVLFNGANAAFTPAPTNNSDLKIFATVPPDAVDGPITIRTPHGDVTSTIPFTVLPPRLMALRDADGRVEVSWPAISDSFVLETAETPGSLTWTAVETALVTTNGSTLFRPGAAGASHFYRLRKK